jgi:hypothetical protein
MPDTIEHFSNEIDEVYRHYPTAKAVNCKDSEIHALKSVVFYIGSTWIIINDNQEILGKGSFEFTAWLDAYAKIKADQYYGIG